VYTKNKRKKYYGNVLEISRNENLSIKNKPISYRSLQIKLNKNVKNGLKKLECDKWSIEEVNVTRSARKKTV